MDGGNRTISEVRRFRVCKWHIFMQLGVKLLLQAIVSRKRNQKVLSLRAPCVCAMMMAAKCLALERRGRQMSKNCHVKVSLLKQLTFKNTLLAFSYGCKSGAGNG